MKNTLKNIFYKKTDDAIYYTRIELEDLTKNSNAGVVKTGELRGEASTERFEFDNSEKAIDWYVDLIKKLRGEEQYYPWTAEYKITMDLSLQKISLPAEAFEEFVNTVEDEVFNYFFNTNAGEISRGIKRIKGGLYSIRVHVIDKKETIKHLKVIIGALTKNPQLGITEGPEELITQFPKFNGAMDLEIEFWSEHHGFIFVTITLGDQIFETRFSEVWDPTVKLRKWLEAICTGVEECSFAIQNEGHDTKFNFMNWWGDHHSLFYAGWERYEMNIVGHVDRHRFVKTFYSAYLTFLDPTTFSDMKTWGQDMQSKFKSKIVEEYLRL